jgi:2'-5' RNA ligase
MPRLFVAVDLPAEVRAQLGALGDEALPGKWVAPEMMHVTLRFLGSVAPAEVERITGALAAVGGPAFALALAGVGAFPQRAARSAGRVLWAGVGPYAPLVALKAALDAVLGPDLEGESRGYSPHVTLARLPHTRGTAFDAYLARHAELTSAAFPVDSFALYESRTLPTGAAYHVLARYPLG